MWRFHLFLSRSGARYASQPVTTTNITVLPWRRAQPHRTEDRRPVDPLRRCGRHRAVPRLVDATAVRTLKPDARPPAHSPLRFRRGLPRLPG
jgi:hypothetical protein